MERLLGLFAEPIYASFRIVAGLLFAVHGEEKLFGWIQGKTVSLSSETQMWIGGLIELVCGLAIALGFQTSWAAFLASGTMAVAYFQFHHRGDAPLPVQNGGELAVIYCFAFLFIAAKGSSVWSVSAPRPK